MLSLRQTIVFCLLVIGGISMPLSGQETDTGEKQESNFEKALAKWTELDSKMKDLQIEFTLETNVSKQTELRNRYTELINEAKVTVDDLRDLATSAFEEDAKNKLALKTLMGIAVNDAKQGDDGKVLELGHKLIDAGVDPRYFELAASSPRLNIDGKEIFEELVIRQKEAGADDLPRVRLVTNRGDIVLELMENEAPETVGNFISLVKSGFYDGLKFHRVIDGFMAQTGDPKADGTGGPGYNIYCECKSPEFRRHFTGTLSMAKQTPINTGGSQFFLTLSRIKSLDGRHTVFGRILSGMDIVQELTKTHTTNPVTGLDQPIIGATPDTITKVEVIRIRPHEYVPNKVEEKEAEADTGDDGESDKDSTDG